MPLSSFLLPRSRLLGAALVLGIGIACATHEPPGERTEAGISALVARAAGEELEQFGWEPSRGALIDLVWGRPVLALTRSARLVRVHLRVSPEGDVVGVRSLHELARANPNSGLAFGVTDRAALLLTDSPEHAPKVTLLALDGELDAPGTTTVGRLGLWLARFAATGEPRGVGRTVLTLTERAAGVRVSTNGETITFHAAGTSETHSLSALLEEGDLRAPESTLLEIDVVRARAPGAWHLLADLGRGAVGSVAIARLEELVFSAKDVLRRAWYRALHPADDHAKANVEATQAGASEAAPRDTHARTARERASLAHAPTFPPRPIEPPLDRSEAGEGVWRPAGDALVSERLAGGPPVFARTFVRADASRPYARTELVVLDMTRLELGLEAGYEDPEPEAGLRGTGHVPRDPSVFRRIVATFNGAFKKLHGGYGMKAGGEVLVPPVVGAATIVIDGTGHTSLGTYQPQHPIALGATNQETFLANARAYRQNLEPLVDGGRLLPSGRTSWGDHLVGGSVAAERSGLCITRDRHLIYAWSLEATAAGLARAMALGDCDYAVHLDMNPGHSTFAFNRIERFEPLVAKGELLDPRMRSSATRYVRWSPKDFFFVSLRSSQPPSVPGSLDFEPAESAAPGFGPAIFRAETEVAGITLEILSVDTSRYSFALEVGNSEHGARPLAEPEMHDAPPLFAFSLGHATRASRPGLALRGATLMPTDRSFASLVLDGGGRPRVEGPGLAPEPTSELSLVEMPLLARNGEPLDEAKRLGSARIYGALCLDPMGNLLLGRITHDTVLPLVRQLLELGCTTVIALDRGSQSPVRFGLEELGAPAAERSDTIVTLRARSRESTASRF